MALDKLVDSTRLDGALTATANAILAKTGGSSALTWDMDEGFSDDIADIPTGTDVSDTTATASDVRTGKYFYTANGTKAQGTIADQAAQTITPTTSDQTIASGKYLTGTQTIKGDANLVAANIAKDVTIFGVTGTHEGGGGGGLVYETGTFTPASDTSNPTIYFTNTHESRPIFIGFTDETGTYDSTNYSNYIWMYYNWEQLFSQPIYRDSSYIMYGLAYYKYRRNSSTGFSSSENEVITKPYANVKTDSFTLNTSISYYCRSGRTYKWIAVWAPTT